MVCDFFDDYSEAEADAADCTRVLVHTDEDWSTWHCFGPMPAQDAEALIGRLGAKFSRPTAIRRGVYEVGPGTMTIGSGALVASTTDHLDALFVTVINFH